MSTPEPHFELVRVLEDGIEEEPEIIPLTALPFDAQMNRRGFLGAAISTTAALAMLMAKQDEADGVQKRPRNTKGVTSYRPAPHRHGTVHRPGGSVRGGTGRHGGGHRVRHGGGSWCSCNKVCVCIPIG